MLIQKSMDCEMFLASDGTLSRELFHPEKHPVALDYSLTHCVVVSGQTSTPRIFTITEVYYILNGQGVISIDGEKRIVQPGDAIYIPANTVRFIHNCADKPLIFICVASQTL